MLGGVAVLAVGVAVAYYIVKKKKDSGSDDVDGGTPKKKSDGISSIKNLMNNLSKPSD